MTFSKLAAASLVAGALALPMAAAAQDPKPGEFKIPGTETTLKLNGFVEVDATYDFDGTDDDIRGNDWASFLEFQPLDDADDVQKRAFYLTSRTSRIGLTTTTPTAWGALNVRMEGDFNTPSAFNFSTEATTNGVAFRMRHAYGEVGGLLIGQTWSNMNDLGSFPDTVDFNGHGAFGASRRPMIRYTLPLGPGSLAVSAENPQNVVSGAFYPASATVGRFWDDIPEFTANLTVPFGAGHVSARAALTPYAAREAVGTPGVVIGGVEVPGTAGSAPGRYDRTWGYTAALSGSLKAGAETVVWGVNGGNGMGWNNFQTLFQGAGFVDGEINLWRAISYHVGLTHAWSDSLRSNVIWSQTFIESDEDLNAVGVFGAPSLNNKRVDAGYVNTFIAPVKNTEFGIEYAYGQRVIPESIAAGGEDKGTQHRVNFLARYTFF